MKTIADFDIAAAPAIAEIYAARQHFAQGADSPAGSAGRRSENLDARDCLRAAISDLEKLVEAIP